MQVFDGAAYHTHLDNMQRLRKGTLQVRHPAAPTLAGPLLETS